MSDHAQLSPSARHRWGACPGSVREEAPFPESPGGAAAIDGTHSHSLLERALTYPGFIVEKSAGEVMKDHEGEFTITADRIERVVFALAYIKERAAAGGTPITETRVHPDGLTGRADLHGTVDVQIPGTQVYEIIDYKDGMSPVEAKNNLQLEQYALGVLAGLDQDKLPKSFQLTIIQPKMRLKGMSGISTWNIPTKELVERVLPTIITQAAATEDPNAPLVPGDEQCKYCRAKGSCKALASKAMEGIGMMFANNPIPTVTSRGIPIDVLGNPVIPTVEVDALDVAHQAAQKDPTKMDDKELAQILDAAPLLEQLIKGVKAEVKARLERGVPVPGYKLVRGNGSRAWKLPSEEMEKKLTVTLKIPKKALYKEVLPTPAALKALTWEKDGTTHQLSAEQIKRVENEWVTYTQGGLVVAPEGDSREAITNDVSSMFGGAIDVQATPVVPPPPFLNVTVPSFFNVSPAPTDNPSFFKV